MKMTRRVTLQVALSALAASAMPLAAQDADSPEAPPTTFETEGGTLTVQPIEHASLFLIAPGHVIAVDPVGDPALYEGQPAPDLILITHEHPDHYAPDLLAALVGEKTKLITNPAVHDMLPEALKARATAMANGDSLDLDTLKIEAIPAYNTTEDRKKYHPQGRDTGYVLTIGGKRFYIAGDTEPTDEMKALKDITAAFIPMNVPYTMTPAQAAEGIAAFAPELVYPYHYRGTDPTELASELSKLGGGTRVVVLDWYPGVDDPTGKAPE